MDIPELSAILRPDLPHAIPYAVTGTHPSLSEKGAYLLILSLYRPVSIARGQMVGELLAGTYAYAAARAAEVALKRGYSAISGGTRQSTGISTN